MKILKWISIIFLGFFIYKVFSPSPPAEEKKELPAITLKEAIASSPSAATPAGNSSRWVYSTTTDKMSGKDYSIAQVAAEESLNFDFPYQGRNMPSILLRKHPKYGVEAILSIAKGQFECGIDKCAILVKFDDKSAIGFSASGPSDHSATVLFISPAGKFIEGLKKSKSTHIQATFYQQGSPVMTFKTDGLVWK